MSLGILIVCTDGLTVSSSIFSICKCFLGNAPILVDQSCRASFVLIPSGKPHSHLVNMAANAAKVGDKWKSILVLAWIASTFSFGLFLFTRGFLLTRIELANHSVSRQWQRTLGLSEDVLLDRIFDEMGLKMPINVTMEYNVPWVTFKKAILLIIDGLRHDFISTTNAEVSNTFYQNNMQHVKHLVDNKMSNSRLFKFIADPPTTTMQRLKALTTGSMIENGC